MNIELKDTKDKVIVLIIGNIDTYGAEKLKKTFETHINTSSKRVEIDFAKVSFIGSAGIGKLLLLYKNFTLKGRELILTNLSDNIKKLFKMIKLDRVFNL